MSTFVVYNKLVRVPAWVTDYPSFQRWANSADFPTDGRISFLNGEVWVDMSKEQFVHNQIKGEIASVLTQLVKENRLGRFFPDGYRLSNDAAELSTNPDGIFVSTRSLRAGRVRLVEGAEQGYVELSGVPDLVLEVISPGTEDKDTVTLYEQYHKAGLPEYWLVDPWGDELTFTIQRHGAKGYTPVRKQAGWQKSPALGQSFRLTQDEDEMGYPQFTLSLR